MIMSIKHIDDWKIIRDKDGYCLFGKISGKDDITGRFGTTSRLSRIDFDKQTAVTQNSTYRLLTEENHHFDDDKRKVINRKFDFCKCPYCSYKNYFTGVMPSCIHLVDAVKIGERYRWIFSEGK